ncbi:MAG: Uncharacterised protein [Flavobacteriaceae bacterium]|jgi:hypothetical protein|nr:MAG: Uncharacterised protein [Flavobacteriaceae bacterium]|tara:strand:+ start:2704 stop:4026 length:1323 start_codon:yes stop_codon:yes gene_type:complete
MIKRLFIVGTITGLAHLLNLITLKALSKFADNQTISLIGEIDSFFLLIVSITTFGLQTTTTRDLAINENTWRESLEQTQSARLIVGIILMLFGLLGFATTKNYLFFFAPVLALNADFALYGRGKPVWGAIISFIRLFVPSAAIIAGIMFWEDVSLPLLFAVSTIFGFLIAGILVSRFLGVGYFVKPQLNNLKLYFTNAPIGIANLSYFFVGLGILNVASYFYSAETISSAYLALKLYFIYTGLRRIIVQTFFKELIFIHQALKVDYLTMIFGVSFASLFVFYPEITLPLLFDEEALKIKNLFALMGLLAFISSISSSSNARMLIKKKDIAYSKNYLIAGISTCLIVVILYYLIGDNPNMIIISCVLGELILLTLNGTALKEKKYYSTRITLILPILVLALLYYAAFIFLEESFWRLTLSFVLLLIASLNILQTLKKLNSK